jgi:naphthoate synthase
MEFEFEDILYEKCDGIARVTINRPRVYNAFRSITIDEMIEAFHDAWRDRSVGVVVLTGTGDRAFSSGGDQKERQDAGGYGNVKYPGGVEYLHSLIRNIPKPVIAAVNGYAIGGGHVLHVICDMSIASETAIFGQTGPRVGSVDPGFGTAYLARVVGEKKAREIWYLCRQYTAQEALEMGLVNKVVPADQLEAEVETWCQEVLEKSPTALKIAKYSFNAESDNIHGISGLGHTSLGLYVTTPEALEGRDAFLEKRPVNFGKFRK